MERSKIVKERKEKRRVERGEHVMKRKEKGRVERS